MSIWENVRVALRALAINKLRSALTMLGIIIGVAAVVALMAIGNGATAEITNEIEGIGSNLVVVMPGRFERHGKQMGATLSYADYEAIANGMHNVDSVIASYETSARLVYGQQTVEVSMTATQPEYESVRASPVAYGRFFNHGDNVSRARVVVLGAQTAADLFGGLNPVGRRIKLNGQFFEVIGVLERKGGFGNADEVALIPLETGYARLFGSRAVLNGERLVSDVSMAASSTDVVTDVMVQAERIMRRQHGLLLSDDLDFTIFSQNAFLDAFAAITATLTIFLGAIAGISLLVGGIGIMNIMLVSVTERTREIGLRKAVGARRSTILFQFLIETMVLSLIGGLVGIALGWGIAGSLRAADLIQAEVTASSIALAFFFAAFVGVFFGIYPASRAARLSPMEALRYE